MRQARTKELHGAALPTVLMLTSLVLIIGLAMGSLSTLSLQFNRRQVDGMKAEMAARGAIANVLAKLRAHDAEHPVNPLSPDPYTVAQVFPNRTVFEEDGYRAVIYFEGSGPEFSRDNLGGDEPAVGSPDRDDIARIPPFGLDLVINVEGPSSQHRFRTVLKKVWPYALYSSHGPIVLAGQPTGSDSSAQPTKVKGDIYTAWLGDGDNGGTAISASTGYGLGQMTSPSAMLAHMEAKAGYQPNVRPAYPAIIGMNLGENPPLINQLHSSSTDQVHYYFYPQSAGNLPAWQSFQRAESLFALSNVRPNGGNLLDGDFQYRHDKEVDGLTPLLVPASVTNEFHGKTIRRRNINQSSAAGWAGLQGDITPGDMLEGAGLESAGFTQLTLTSPDSDLTEIYGFPERPGAGLLPGTGPGVPIIPGVGTGTGGESESDQSDPEIHYDTPDGKSPYFLASDLDLTAGGHFRVDGSVSNREVLYYEGMSARGPGLYIREAKVGLKMQNAILHVKGDLDLGASSFGATPEDSIPIWGSGATLIVDGKLVLGNATINAADQGFVIVADDIVFKGGGEFFGLMIAKNSITILSQNENRLRIRGGLICFGGAGIMLRGCDLEHDPEYLKSLNGAGEFQVVSWKRI